MKRLALFVLAAAIPASAVFAQFDEGSTTEKIGGGSPAPAASPAAAAPAAAAPAAGSSSSLEPAPTPGTTHGAHTGIDPSSMGMGGGAPAGAAPTKPGPEGKLTVDTGEVSFDMPNTWKSVQPASMMRKAQVAIPKLDGDPDDGEISISFFPGGGGGVDANVSRWFGQFETADGKPVNETAKREALKAGALEVVLVDITGTMKASGMPGMGPTTDRKDWHMLGGIVVTPAGPWFFKATGPEKTMVAARDAFKALLTSVKTK